MLQSSVNHEIFFFQGHSFVYIMETREKAGLIYNCSPGTHLSHVVRMPKHFCRRGPFPRDTGLWITFANRHQSCRLSLPACPTGSVASNPCSFCPWEKESCHHDSKDLLGRDTENKFTAGSMKFKCGDFPGSPVVKVLSTLPMQGTQVQSLVGELRSYLLRGVDKNSFKTSKKKLKCGGILDDVKSK